MKETMNLHLPEVIELSNISKDTIYKLMRVGKFPKNRAMRDLPSRRVWSREEVLSWVNGQ